MAYRVEVKRSAEKDLATLPKRDQRRIISAAEDLADNPHPEGVRKLTTIEDAYRLRAGNYRIIYQIAENVLTVFVVRIRHRKDVYRRK